MKKLIPILIIAFLLCFIGETSAANKFYWATGLTGTTGTLDSIDGANLTDGDMAIVGYDNSGTYEFYAYRLEDYASNPPDEASPDTITPNTNAESKRWKLLTVHAVGFVGPLTGNVTGDLTGNADTATLATLALGLKLADDSTVIPPAAAVTTDKSGIQQTTDAGASTWIEPTSYCFLTGIADGNSFDCATPTNALAALQTVSVYGELTTEHLVIWYLDGGVWKQKAGNLPLTDNTVNGEIPIKTCSGEPEVCTMEGATAGTNYTSPSSTESFTNKTLDANGTGNVLKGYSYLQLSSRAFMRRGAGVSAPSTTQTDFNYGIPKFDDATDEATNWIDWVFEVPADIDTAVALTAKLSFYLGGADTADHDYVVSMCNPAASAAADCAVGNAINLTYTADAAGADGDIEYTAETTLTDWAAALTAGRMLKVRLARDGDDGANDASTVDSYPLTLTIKYGYTN